MQEEVKAEEKVEATAEAATESINATKTEGREERLEKLSKYHILASMGVGLIPLPIVDIAAMMGIQLNMVRKLAEEYDVPFKKDAGKAIISSLMGGVLPIPVGFALISLIKFIPLIGQTTGAVTMPVVAGASTYAIYKVFVKHFESNGTFMDFDTSKAKTYFKEQFSKGKTVAADLKAEKT
jgi:uncharacterized protein (DUF697 family)